MEKWHIALVAISINLVLAFLIGIMAGKGKSFFSLSVTRWVQMRPFELKNNASAAAFRYESNGELVICRNDGF